jgi:hypothetical protein
MAMTKRTPCTDAYLKVLGLTGVPERGTQVWIDLQLIKHMDTNGFGSARTLCTVAQCSPAMLRHRMVRLRDRGLVRRVKGGAEAVSLGCVCLLTKRRAYTLTGTARKRVWDARLRQRSISKLGKAPKRTRAGRWS